MIDPILAPFRIRRVAALRPIFIVGCGHSGTTLIAAMLDSHPRIMTFPGESNAFLMRKWRSSAPRILGAFARKVRDAGRSRLCEKTPRHILHLAKIFDMFPEARVIYMMRDGRDVALSIAKRTNSIDEGVSRWLGDNEQGLSVAAHHQGVHLLKYEDLVENPQAALERVCAFIGESFDPAMLDYAKTERKWYGVKEVADPGDVFVGDKDATLERHKLKRNWQINQGVFDGRGKWREAPPELIAQIEPRIRPMLDRFGYV